MTRHLHCQKRQPNTPGADRASTDCWPWPGPETAAGQSGSIQGLPDTADVDSESVEELAEEGNAFEAGIVEGVEDAKDPDVSEVKTRSAAGQRARRIPG